MKYIENIINVIEEELNINRQYIIKAIRKNKANYKGDYTIICYMLKNQLVESPIIIAEKIVEVLNNKGIENIQLEQTYINIYLDNKVKIKSFLYKVNRNTNKYEDNKVNIIYKLKKFNEMFTINDLYKCIVIEFIYKIHLIDNYNVHKNNFLGNEKNLNDTYIINKIREEQLISKYCDKDIINLKYFNLPPLILENNTENKYEVTLKELSDLLYKINCNEINKIIIINNRYEKLKTKQILAVLKSIDYDIENKISNIYLGFIKLNENIKKYENKPVDTIKLIYKRSKDEVIEALENNNVLINKEEIEKIILQNINFKFLSKNLGSDIIFDYEDSFNYKNNIYLQVKILEMRIYESIKTMKKKKRNEVYTHNDLIIEIELIHIIEEFEMLRENQLVTYRIEKFISILEKIVVFSYKMYKEECEIILFYEVIYNIIGIILRYIEISTDILIENIQKLTEY